LIAVGETVARPPTPFVRDAGQALERAQRAFERGRLEEAINLLEQALGMGADTAAARTMLGLAYARSRQVDRALEHLEHAAELEPEAFGPQCALGELHMRLCAVEPARQYLARALECASTAAERSYVQRLLHEERVRDRQRIPRPSFRKPFWPRRS
jgi:tetratricopeptide (TPR) repeat protein